MGVISTVARRPSGKQALHADLDKERMAALVAYTARSLRTSYPRPFGASVVHTKTGRVLLRALNKVAQECDPSAHAEVRTIRLATKRLKKISLAGYTLYTTCEPCPMCMSAALWARLDRVVFGATIEMEVESTGDVVIYQIVGDDEADLKEGKISIGSPLSLIHI